MTDIINIYNNWKDVKNVSRTTVNKEHSEIEATSKFKKAILISEHSPIREIIVRWRWSDIKSWIATHFARSKWEIYISTQRSDRTGVDRDKLPQDSLVNADCSANAQHLIDTSRKRLCFGSNVETIKKWANLKNEIKNNGEEELADSLVPNGIYRCGCPEFINCGKCESILSTVKNITNIQERYDAFNKVFYDGKWV